MYRSLHTPPAVSMVQGSLVSEVSLSDTTIATLITKWAVIDDLQWMFTSKWKFMMLLRLFLSKTGSLAALVAKHQPGMICEATNHANWERAHDMSDLHSLRSESRWQVQRSTSVKNEKMEQRKSELYKTFKFFKKNHLSKKLCTFEIL